MITVSLKGDMGCRLKDFETQEEFDKWFEREHKDERYYKVIGIIKTK